MNQTKLIGNLARDPEIRYTQSGKAIALFTIAAGTTFYAGNEQKELTDFIPCVAWGNLAEAVGNTLSKGSRVTVTGRISIRSYDGSDGQKRYRTEVVCNFIGKSIVETQQSSTTTQVKQAEPGQQFSNMGHTVQNEEIPF